MEATTPNSAPSPTSASIDGRHSSPPPRNSMEDADSSVTRKRPRLDSGHRAHQNITSPFFGGVSAESSRIAVVASPNNEQSTARGTSPGSDMQGRQAKRMTGTPSKVTLNIRDHQHPHSPTAQRALSTTHSPHSSDTSSTMSHRPSPEPEARGAHSVPANDISSDHEEGVHIEICEHEDMDPMQETSTWQQLSEDDRLVWLQEHVDDFPTLDPISHSWEQEMREIPGMAMQEPGLLADTIAKIAEWINTYLLQTRQMRPYWYELAHRQRNFWHSLPTILSFLSGEAFLSTASPSKFDWQEAAPGLNALLQAFANLTARMISMDHDTLLSLKDERASEPVIFSLGYIQALRRIYSTKSEGRPLRALERLGVDISLHVQQIACGDGSSSSILTGLADCLPHLLARPSLDGLLQKLLNAVLTTPTELLSLQQRLNRIYSTTEPDGISGSFSAYFDSVNNSLRSAIKKQFPALSGDLLANLFVQHLQVLVKALPELNLSLLRVYATDDEDAVLALSLSDRSQLALAMWKVDLFQRCVREGRMEIRITGLDALQIGLIEIYNTYIRPKMPRDQHHPVVELISDQLLRSKLVDYLLSVDSHPQIISRSGNVVGFLAVGGRWTDQQTDLIWQSVRATEDQRVSETIIDMLYNGVTKFLEWQDLVYFITRMKMLTISEFDGKIRKLFLLVCTQLVEKSPEESSTVLVLMRTFATLLRNASSDPAVHLPQKQHMWEMVQDGFRNLAAVEWPVEARMSIYQECCRDIEEQSTGTSGSCAIMRQLLERHAHTDVPILSSELDATHLVVADLGRLRELEALTATDFEHFRAPVEDRLRILESMILQLPDTISSDVSQQLWSNMFTEKAVGNLARELAWDMLARVAVQSKSSNVFLDRCIEEHLPGLAPALYSRSTLHFANCVFDYETRTASVQDPHPRVGITSQASAELYWQLALDADDDAISSKASQALIQQAGTQMQGTPESDREELRLIEKAIDQLVDVGTQLSLQDVNKDRGSGLTVLQRRFKRLFAMLGHFIAAVQFRSPSSPSNRSDSQSSNSIVGEVVQIQYITSDRGKPSSVKKIDLGENETFEDLMAKLRMRTGFSKFNVIVGGQRLNQDKLASEKLAALGIQRKGIMLLHRIPGSELLRATSDKGSVKQVETIILRHFDRLYELLTATDNIAFDVLKLLRSIGPHEEVVQIVCNLANSQAQVLPLQHPYKASYSLHAIEAKQRAHLSDGTIDHDFMQHSITVLGDALFALELPMYRQRSTATLGLLQEILDVFLTLMKEPVPSNNSSQYFTDPCALVAKLHKIAESEYQSVSPAAFRLVQSCFACLLEASAINDTVWGAFKAHQLTPVLFERLILSNPDDQARMLMYKTIKSVLATLSGTASSSKTSSKQRTDSSPGGSPLRFVELAEFFWQKSCELVLDAATRKTSSCQHFFALASDLFTSLEKSVHDLPIMQGHLQAWIRILIHYQPQHHVGRNVTDYAVTGLSELIYQAMVLLKTKDASTETGFDFHKQILDTLLFPPIYDSEARRSATVVAPVLGSQTRSALYKLILRSAVDSGNPAHPLEQLKSILNDDQTAHLPFMGFDRSRCMRTSAGYPGLDNLSNTCYLNSLMTQLFMNLPFRRFILQQVIFDPVSQALLLATQRLFANLQDGWQKSVCTKELARSIQTYDGPLDTTIQMDADEAFNLLFDRLESQLPDGQDKAAFKRLFGGQIIQQIKSKECEHVSERFEPITAVQCDIQGKHSLNQSLNAYIEGENMEGDNKYKCSKCDRYVNAVKRACLKDIPDNLIFHLKRFDFDLMSGNRSKVNDYFEFPANINMSPYTIEYLEGDIGSARADEFILVGVLVHNGTAEIGHYYSYMREWPASSGPWVEFNDSEVSRFDPNLLGEQCFGGSAEASFNQSFPKSWNAYMLFYQRKSAAQDDQDELGQLNERSPTKAIVDGKIGAEIATNNEVMARTFCLSAQEHTIFVRELLNAILRKTDSECSESHASEDTAIECAWTHLEKIFAKEPKCQGTNDVLAFLENMTGRCNRCCLSSLRWVLDSDEARLRSVLLRTLDADLRSKVVEITIRCLQGLKLHMPDVYNSDEDGDDGDVAMRDGIDLADRRGLLAQILDRLSNLQPLVAINWRAWPDFYRLLCEITMFGPLERLWVRESGFLQYSLEVLLIDAHHDWASRYSTAHSNYIRLFEKRNYDLSGLVDLIALLLEGMQVQSTNTDTPEAVDDIGRRRFITSSEKAPLTVRLVPEGGDVRVPWVLERAAAVSTLSLENKSIQALTRFVLRNENALGLKDSVLSIIGHGIVKNPAELATPYLLITLELLRAPTSTHLIEHVIQLVSDGTKTIGESGGSQHLDFFRRALCIQSDEASTGQPRQIRLAVTRRCPLWGLALLEYPDYDVTHGCFQTLNKLLFDLSPGDEEDEEAADIRGGSIQSLWTQIRQLIHKYAHDNRALDEPKRALLSFGESFLAQGVETDPNVVESSLIAQASSMITLPDDAGSNTFESDDLTDVSSTYESPGVGESA